MNLVPLIVSYSVVLTISSIFAGYLWFSYRHDLLKLTFFLWISVIVGFVAQGAFNNLELTGFIAYSCNLVTVVILLLLSDETSDENKLPIKRFVWILVLSLIISILLLIFKASYTLSTLPFSLACGISLFFGAFYKKVNSPLQMGYRILMVASGFHYLDYPFLRVDPRFAIVGFSMGLVFTICYAIIVPLFVMRLISDRYTQELELTVEHRTLELKESNEKLLKSIESLATSNHDLDALSKENHILLNVVIHDLSNPINAMVGAVNQIKKAVGDNQNLAPWFEIVETSMINIKNTTVHVGTFHAAKFGKVSLQPSTVDLDRILEALKEEFSDAMKVKSLSIEIEKGVASPIRVWGEESRLKNQVMANLISNAIKFSHPGGKIKITVNQNEHETLILIKDFGVGISDEKASSIFNSSTPTSTFGTSGEKGMGLGLSIVHHYTKLMGGEIRLMPADSVGQGTCFELKLKPSLSN